MRPFPYIHSLSLVVTVLLASACNDAASPPKVAPEPPSAPISPVSVAVASASAPATPAAPGAAIGKAEVGKAAPDFELRDIDGKAVKLSAFKGKVVVLEWFNPGCPFVKAAHTKGTLKTAAKDAMAKGVVWLAINSAAEGYQGFGPEANRDGASKLGLTHPVLLDPAGEVGHAYGATNTPHVFVIDEAGTLVYRGAADNSPDGEGESPTGGKLVSYVGTTLADLAAKRPVSVATTQAYGCSVKYAKK